MTFNKMWRAAAPVWQQIKYHPWTQEVDNGSLPFYKFKFFIRSDALYLKNFAYLLQHTSHRLISNPDTINHGLMIGQYAEKMMQTELNMLNKYLGQRGGSTTFFQPLIKCPEETQAFRDYSSHQKHTVRFVSIKEAFSDYTSHQKHAVRFGSIEEAIAALLPCYKVYAELGKLMSASTFASNHPYKRWVQTYSDPEFLSALEELIQILEWIVRHNQFCHEEKANHAFVKSMKFELAIFQSAYSAKLDHELRDDSYDICNHV